jgi:hypothetical protein
MWVPAPRERQAAASKLAGGEHTDGPLERRQSAAAAGSRPHPRQSVHQLNGSKSLLVLLLVARRFVSSECVSATGPQPTCRLLVHGRCDSAQRAWSTVWPQRVYVSVFRRPAIADESSMTSRIVACLSPHTRDRLAASTFLARRQQRVPDWTAAVTTTESAWSLFDLCTNANAAIECILSPLAMYLIQAYDTKQVGTFIRI